MSARFPRADLGDGVYAESDASGNVVLTWSTDRIILEPAVVVQFERWLRARRDWVQVEADRAARAGVKP